MFMDCFAVFATQLKWLANVTQVDFILTTVTDICPISFAPVLFSTLITIVMPYIIPIYLILSHLLLAFVVYIYWQYCRLINKYTDDKVFDNIAHVLARFWHYYGRLWHGFEVEGLENIPSKGSGVIVVYHGPIAVDAWLMGSHIYLFRNRLIRPVINRYFFRIRGSRFALSLLKALPGSIETCTRILNDGHLMCVTPGGAYECVFGDNNYRLLWRNHTGYAKVAIEAKSPIIPVFTVNIGDAYRNVNICQSWFKILYRKWKLPVVPSYGGLPVKLKTIVGKPIAFDPALTAEELNRKVIMSMEQLIKDHQRVPGSMTMALLDRFYNQKKVKAV